MFSLCHKHSLYIVCDIVIRERVAVAAAAAASQRQKKKKVIFLVSSWLTGDPLGRNRQIVRLNSVLPQLHRRRGHAGSIDDAHLSLVTSEDVAFSSRTHRVLHEIDDLHLRKVWRRNQLV